ncbi:MAG: phosphatase PAP2 family protein, partial [Actinobacteria bacterium]|nr:phosphatase PAP2 family protein [Actinomycetota bacterium]
HDDAAEGALPVGWTTVCTGRLTAKEAQVGGRCDGVHGTTDLVRAVERSCNVFYYRAAARVGIALGLESGLVNLGVKSLFRRTRPVYDGPRPYALRRPLTSSFPSGHATSGFMAAALLSDGDEKVAPLYYGLATVIAVSRVYVKIHHASDVAAGAALGMVLGRVARHVAPLEAIEESEVLSPL